MSKTYARFSEGPDVINDMQDNITSLLLIFNKSVVFRQQMLFFHNNNDFYLYECTASWKIIICCRKTTFLLKIINSDAMMLSASIIASGASVDYSVENQLSEAKKSKNLDFEQKVKIDSEAPICCHEFDLSNIINW